MQNDAAVTVLTANTKVHVMLSVEDVTLDHLAISSPSGHFQCTHVHPNP